MPRGNISLSVTRLARRFDGWDGLHDLSLSFREGEVHALIGPNGAGRNTLIDCIGGTTVPDDGLITIRADSFAALSPRSASRAGVALIHRDLHLVASLTAQDNIFLGTNAKRISMVARSERRRRATELLESLDVDIALDKPVGQMASGEQRIVAIVRALIRDPAVVVLDEPTVTLNNDEVTTHLDLVRRLAKDHGLAVIVVSQFMRQVLEVADVVTAFQDGRMLWTRDVGDLVLADLFDAIAPPSVVTARPAHVIGGPLLSVRSLRTPNCGPVDVTVHQGEIVCLFGLSGSGNSSMVRAIAGAEQGEAELLEVLDQQYKWISPSTAVRAGIGFVPACCDGDARFTSMSLEDNVALPMYVRASRLFRNRRSDRENFEHVAIAAGVDDLPPEMPIQEATRGIAQRLSVARWLTSAGHCNVLVIDQPTEGVEGASRAGIQALLADFVRRENCAVLFASADPALTSALADRVLVISSGRVVRELRGQFDERTLLATAT